jgi:hypothetical protein
MAETIEDITINWEDEEGRLLGTELKQEVLTKGSWSTIMFLYQEMDKRTGEYKAPKIRVGRYQKRGGRYSLQSKFNISSARQARQLVEVLGQWLPGMGDEEE